MGRLTLSTVRPSHRTLRPAGWLARHRHIAAGWIVLVAALAIAGCGSSSSSSTTTTPTNTAAEVAKEAHERAVAAKEEAETAALKARAAREDAAIEHREKRERVGEEAHEHAEREAEENSPESHHYPPPVRAGFLHGCEHSTGHENSACECALKRIEAKVPLGRYRENEHEIVAGRSLPLIYSIEYGYCVGSEAVEQ